MVIHEHTLCRMATGFFQDVQRGLSPPLTTLGYLISLGTLNSDKAVLLNSFYTFTRQHQTVFRFFGKARVVRHEKHRHSLLEIKLSIMSMMLSHVLQLLYIQSRAFFCARIEVLIGSKCKHGNEPRNDSDGPVSNA